MRNAYDLGAFDYILVKIFTNLPWIIILSVIVYGILKIYLRTKEILEEYDLFNFEKMSLEEKKLVFFTKRLTYINMTNPAKADFLANKGKDTPNV